MTAREANALWDDYFQDVAQQEAVMMEPQELVNADWSLGWE